ncbi:MAG: hypothetical protein P8014_19870, partial [Acidihalobacter sp.]|uniref:hypothetical protein n=1 Tax=Acidihalobacter sp. TaxID=1872108 RepID=UPI00307EEBA0
VLAAVGQRQIPERVVCGLLREQAHDTAIMIGFALAEHIRRIGLQRLRRCGSKAVDAVRGQIQHALHGIRLSGEAGQDDGRHVGAGLWFPERRRAKITIFNWW